MPSQQIHVSINLILESKAFEGGIPTSGKQESIKKQPSQQPNSLTWRTFPM